MNGKLVWWVLAAMLLISGGATAGYIGAYDRRLAVLEDNVGVLAKTQAQQGERLIIIEKRQDRQEEIIAEVREILRELRADLKQALARTRP